MTYRRTQNHSFRNMLASRAEKRDEEKRRTQYAIILNIVALVPRERAEELSRTLPIEDIDVYLDSFEKIERENAAWFESQRQMSKDWPNCIANQRGE